MLMLILILLHAGATAYTRCACIREPRDTLAWYPYQLLHAGATVYGASAIADLARDVRKLVYVNDLLDPTVVGPVVNGRRFINQDGLAVISAHAMRHTHTPPSGISAK